MSENPYTPPSAYLGGAGFDRPASTGEIDVGRCLSDAWAATWENFPLWLGVGLVGTAAMGLAAVTVVGLVLAIPHLVWGGAYFVLRMLDGEAEFGDLFAGFARYGQVLVAMLAAFVLLALINVLFQSVQMLGAAAESGLLLAAGYLVSLAFGLFVSPRLSLCFFYIVERDMNGVEALQEAWSSTSRVPIWIFPVLVVVTYAIVLAGLLVLVVGVIPAVVMSYLVWASAYRQLEGPPSAG